MGRATAWVWTDSQPSAPTAYARGDDSWTERTPPLPALVDAILRTSVLVEDLPQIQELDLNPILVYEQGATIVDARVRVAPAGPMPLMGARR